MPEISFELLLVISPLAHAWMPNISTSRLSSLNFFFKKDLFILFYNYWCFASRLVCSPCACLMTTETRRGYWAPYNWNYGWLWVTMWVVGIKQGSAERASFLSSPGFTCFLILYSRIIYYIFLCSLNNLSDSFPILINASVYFILFYY